jgi:drug/metabolite transporter (DMT)-like permease
MRPWMIYATLSMLAWAAWSLLSPLASAGLSGGMVQCLSSVGLLPVAIGLLCLPNRRPHPHLGKGLALATLTGLLAGLGNVMVYRALENGGPVSIVFPISSLAPLVPVLAAPILFRERLIPLQVAAIAVALVAIVLLNTNTSAEPTAATSSSLVSAWMMYAVLSLIIFGITFLPQKGATYFISDELSTVAFAGGFILLDVALLATDRSLTWNIPRLAGGVSLLIGVLMGLGSLTLFQAYRHGKASIVTPYVQLFPVISVVVGVPLYHEKLDWWRGIGIVAAIGAGLVLSLEREEPKQGTHSLHDPPREGTADQETKSCQTPS